MHRDLARISQVEDATGAWLTDASHVAGVGGGAACVARPGSPEEVAAVVAWCYDHDVPIVPRGGGTGYCGGAVPRTEDAVVLSLNRLTRVRALDPLQWRVRVDAGVTTQTVQRLARENGLWFAVDPGAAEQSQIGGNVATNAGGPHCFKHGVMRTWLLGVEAVLAPGELVTLGGPVRKDVAGYDLTGLLCGSEGTLGVVTGAWLRLAVPPRSQVPLACVYDTVEDGCDAIARVMACGEVPGAIEFLDAGALRAAPGVVPAGELAVLVDAEGGEEELLDALGPGALRPDPAAVWRWRDGVGIAVAAARGGKLSEDIAVPVDRLAEAIRGTVAIGRRHGLAACSWGHAGDGNLHSTFLLGPGDDASAAAEDLFALAVELGGTVSGEHGLGLLKTGQLERQWAPAALDAHEAVKRALDPKGLLNPGKKLARRG